MNDATDHERDDLAGDLATVTDEEWRHAHERLWDEVADEVADQGNTDHLDQQFEYEWSPDAAE